MDRHPPQTSLAAILLALTALSVVFASWTWAGEARIFVMPIAGAFFGGVVVRYGFYWGLVIAVAIVIVNAVLMEKDPSGLGPTEVVVPIHLIVFAIPVFIAAWIGSKLSFGSLDAIRSPLGISVEPVGIRVKLTIGEVIGIVSPAPTDALRRQIQQHDARIAPIIQQKPVVGQRDRTAARYCLLDCCSEVVDTGAL